jgi:hypothetical protein
MFREGTAMKNVYLGLFISLSLILSACSSINSQEPVDLSGKSTLNSPLLIKPKCPPPPKKKNPMNVSLYTPGIKPQKNYLVLGNETISKFNQNGIKRQKANIHDLLRNIAASMGGDAVINLRYDQKMVSGTVIKYKNKGLA